METIDLIIVWLSLVTLLGLLVALCSAYFAYWMLVIRNPMITEVIADYKIRQYNKEE